MHENFDLKALQLAIDDQRLQRGLNWSDVAKEIEEQFTKVSVSTIRDVGNKTRAEGDGVLQMLLWLNLAPENFIPKYKGEISPLSPAERGKFLDGMPN